MKSGDLRNVLGVSSYKSDWQKNRMVKFKLEQNMELFRRFARGRFLRSWSVSWNLERSLNYLGPRRGEA